MSPLSEVRSPINNATHQLIMNQPNEKHRQQQPERQLCELKLQQPLCQTRHICWRRKSYHHYRRRILFDVTTTIAIVWCMFISFCFSNNGCSVVNAQSTIFCRCERPDEDLYDDKTRKVNSNGIKRFQDNNVRQIQKAKVPSTEVKERDYPGDRSDIVKKNLVDNVLGGNNDGDGNNGSWESFLKVFEGSDDRGRSREVGPEERRYLLEDERNEAQLQLDQQTARRLAKSVLHSQNHEGNEKSIEKFDLQEYMNRISLNDEDEDKKPRESAWLTTMQPFKGLSEKRKDSHEHSGNANGENKKIGSFSFDKLQFFESLNERHDDKGNSRNTTKNDVLINELKQKKRRSDIQNLFKNRESYKKNKESDVTIDEYGLIVTRGVTILPQKDEACQNRLQLFRRRDRRYLQELEEESNTDDEYRLNGGSYHSSAESYKQNFADGDDNDEDNDSDDDEGEDSESDDDTNDIDLEYDAYHVENEDEKYEKKITSSNVPCDSRVLYKKGDTHNVLGSDSVLFRRSAQHGSDEMNTFHGGVERRLHETKEFLVRNILGRESTLFRKSEQDDGPSTTTDEGGLRGTSRQKADDETSSSTSNSQPSPVSSPGKNHFSLKINYINLFKKLKNNSLSGTTDVVKDDEKKSGSPKGTTKKTGATASHKTNRKDDKDGKGMMRKDKGPYAAVTGKGQMKKRGKGGKGDSSTSSKGKGKKGKGTGGKGKKGKMNGSKSSKKMMMMGMSSKKSMQGPTPKPIRPKSRLIDVVFVCPDLQPTRSPSPSLSLQPSDQPSITPFPTPGIVLQTTESPTSTIPPSNPPSDTPTTGATTVSPSDSPSSMPTATSLPPSEQPSDLPSNVTNAPSDIATLPPSNIVSVRPTAGGITSAPSDVATTPSIIVSNRPTPITPVPSDTSTTRPSGTLSVVPTPVQFTPFPSNIATLPPSNLLSDRPTQIIRTTAPSDVATLPTTAVVSDRPTPIDLTAAPSDGSSPPPTVEVSDSPTPDSVTAPPSDDSTLPPTNRESEIPTPSAITSSPSDVSTLSPTNTVSDRPTPSNVTTAPSDGSTLSPTNEISDSPTGSKTTARPSDAATSSPTSIASDSPTPSDLTFPPTNVLSDSPTTNQPTPSEITSAPSRGNTPSPTSKLSESPTSSKTTAPPSNVSTSPPTIIVSDKPTPSDLTSPPTNVLSDRPTNGIPGDTFPPTNVATVSPTNILSRNPTPGAPRDSAGPTVQPTSSPSDSPTSAVPPSDVPTPAASDTITNNPSLGIVPSSDAPTDVVTNAPTA